MVNIVNVLSSFLVQFSHLPTPSIVLLSRAYEIKNLFLQSFKQPRLHYSVYIISVNGYYNHVYTIEKVRIQFCNYYHYRRLCNSSFTITICNDIMMNENGNLVCPAFQNLRVYKLSICSFTDADSHCIHIGYKYIILKSTLKSLNTSLLIL